MSQNKIETTRILQSNQRGYIVSMDGVEIEDFSENGFNYGYGGSGPNNLAWAIIYTVAQRMNTDTSAYNVADRLKHKFVTDHVSTWKGNETYEVDVETWIQNGLQEWEERYS